jgi:hypothetical protein
VRQRQIPSDNPPRRNEQEAKTLCHAGATQKPRKQKPESMKTTTTFKLLAVAVVAVLSPLASASDIPGLGEQPDSFRKGMGNACMNSFADSCRLAP